MTDPAARPAPPAPAITLRRARPDDADDFERMMGDPAVFAGVLQMPYPDAASWRERLALPGGAGAMDLHLVAVHEQRVVGSAGIHTLGPHVRRRHAMALGMSVAADWQGRGVGTRLLEALVDHADRWIGVLRLELTVYADNARAIALYRRFGFEVEGTLRAFALRDGVYVDALAMARLHPSPPRWTPAGGAA